MSGNKKLYSINLLIKKSDIDVFTALKQAGSRAVYFEKLENFCDVFPDMLTQLENQYRDTAALSKTLHSIQNKLLEIGATDYVWEVERFAGLEKDGDGYTAEVVALTEKLRSLLTKIEQSKLEADASNPEEERAQPYIMARNAPSQRKTPSENAGSKERQKPRGKFKPEPFEKIKHLIENLEMDVAVSMLSSQLGYTYNKQIDALMVSAYNDIANFSYDKALKKLSDIIEFMWDIEETEKKNGKKKILAIDDMPDILRTVKSILSDKYDVYCVTDHKAALRFLSGGDADLILLDIEMPDMDGFTLLNIIRKMKGFEDKPVVFLTGNVSVENVKKSYYAGSNDFIKKPIDPEVLIGRIQKHLNQV